jgi:hypothetical protein
MSAEPGPIRILAVDDHALLREGIAGLVAGQSDMTLVAQALNGREAIHPVPYPLSGHHRPSRPKELDLIPL